MTVSGQHAGAPPAPAGDDAVRPFAVAALDGQVDQYPARRTVPGVLFQNDTCQLPRHLGIVQHPLRIGPREQQVSIVGIRALRANRAVPRQRSISASHRHPDQRQMRIDVSRGPLDHAFQDPLRLPHRIRRWSILL